MNSAQDAATPPSWIRFLLFTAMLAICGISQWYIFHRLEWVWATWALCIGAFAAAAILGPPEPLGVAGARPAPPDYDRGIRTIMGAVLSVVGCGLAIWGGYVLSTEWTQRFGMGFGAVVGGTAAWSLGLSMADHSLRKDVPKIEWRGWEIFGFLLILAFGLFLRFYQYDYFPPPDGICAIEEPQSGQGAIGIRNGARPWEFLLDRWLPVPFMVWLGDTFTAIRVPFTLVSWLTIIPLYLLLRELVSRPAALSATLLFAFCRWHLIYARHAHAVFGPTLPIILFALYFCVRAYRRGGLAPYPWIGLLSAYTLYSYAGYRATTAFVGLFFLISIVQHLREMRAAPVPSAREAVQRSMWVQVGGFALAGIAFAVLVVPLYFRLTLNPGYFMEAAVRATDAPQYYHDDTARMLEQRIERIRMTAMMFNHLGDGSATFNMPGRPQIDPVSGTLMTLGLAYGLIWAGFRMQGFFTAFFLIVLAFGTVFTHNFDIRRLQGIIPLIFIMIAFFLDGAGKFTERRLGRFALVPLALVGVIGGGVAFADNYRVYFREMMNSTSVRSSFHTTYTVAIRYYHDLPDNAYMVLISDMGNFFLPSDYEWWRGDRLPGAATHDLWPLFAGKEGPWKGRELHVVIQRPMYEGAELAEVILKRFPNADCSEWRHPDGPLFSTFMACKIPSEPDGKIFAGGIRARYYRGEGADPLVDRMEPVVSYGFLPDQCHFPSIRHVAPCRARWEGTWVVPEDGKYQLMANARNGDLTVWINGEAVRSDVKAAGDSTVVQKTLSLKAGEHSFVMESAWNQIEILGTRVRARKVGDSTWSLLEFADLTKLVPEATVVHPPVEPPVELPVELPGELPVEPPVEPPVDSPVEPTADLSVEPALEALPPAEPAIVPPAGEPQDAEAMGESLVSDGPQLPAS